MKKGVLLFGLKMALMVLCLLGFVFVVTPQYTTGYNAALLDKMEYLKSIDEPRIIIVGDSNVAYGIDSVLIEQEFGMPVVNMGLHGGLGQPFYTEMLRKYIHSGDIIVLAPAECQYTTTRIIDSTLAWNTLETHLELWSNVPREWYGDLAKSFPTYLKKCVSLWINGTGNQPSSGQHSYSRSAFNQQGDNVFPRPNLVLQEPFGQSYVGFPLSVEMKDYWNSYANYAQSKNVALYMSCPPVFQQALSNNLLLAQQSLEDGLEFQVISNFDDYIFDASLFYDTVLHLNDSGKVLRTRQLIEDLRPYISSN